MSFRVLIRCDYGDAENPACDETLDLQEMPR